MLEAYRAHVAERAQLGIPPLPLTAQQTAELTEQILSGQRPIPAPIAAQVQQIKALHTAMTSPSPQNTAALLAFNRSED